MKHSQILLLVLASILVSACAKQKADEETTLNALNSSVEGGITSLSAVIDDQANSSFVASEKPSPYVYAEMLFDKILPKARLGLSGLFFLNRRWSFGFSTMSFKPESARETSASSQASSGVVTFKW